MNILAQCRPGAAACLITLLLAAACSPGGRTGPAEEAASPAGSAGHSRQSPRHARSGLEYRRAGAAMARAERIVVLLHGYGSRPDDLMGLAATLKTGAPTAFLFPTAPIDLGSGRRAWNLPDGTGIEDARQRVLDLLAELHAAHPGAVLVAGGFSQGGNVAVNLLSTNLPGVEAVLLFSPGSVLDHDLRRGESRPAVFLSHGSKDGILPFAGSQRLHRQLEEAGYPVTWIPFTGGHAIPAVVLEAANAFLADALPAP